MKHINITDQSEFGRLLLLLLFIDLHLSFEDLIGLGESLLKNSHESVQMFLGVLWHYAHSEPGLTDLYHWVLDSVYVYTLIKSKITHVHHQSRHQSRNDLISYEHWQNSARVSKHFSAVLVELAPQVMIVLQDFLSQLTSHF